MYVLGLRYGVYHKTVMSEIAPITSVLTFLYISFAKIFCQNKIKKNRKPVLRISLKNNDMGREESRVNLPDTSTLNYQ